MINAPTERHESSSDTPSSDFDIGDASDDVVEVLERRPDGTLSMGGVLQLLERIDSMTSTFKDETPAISNADLIQKIKASDDDVAAFSRSHSIVFRMWTATEGVEAVRRNLLDMIKTKQRVEEDSSMSEHAKDLAVGRLNERVLKSCMPEDAADAPVLKVDEGRDALTTKLRDKIKNKKNGRARRGASA